MDLQMIFLIVIMFITMFFSDKSKKKSCVQIVTVIMTLFSGLRTWWFGDLIKYYTLYSNCNGSEWRDYVFEDFGNIGIRLFFRSFGAVGLSYDVCIFVIAAFVAVTLGVLVYRYSPSPYWSYVIYIAMGFYLFTFTGLKQAIAMSFIMIAFIGLVGGNFKNFLIWTLIAGLFHAPALIFLIVYPMSKKKLDWQYALIILGIIVAVFVFKNQIIEFMSEAYYGEGDKFEESGSLLGGRFLMMAFIIVIGMILRPIRQNDVVYCKVFNIMIIASILQMFSAYDNNFTRLADYYYQFIVLFLPLMLETGGERVLANTEIMEDVIFHDNRIYVFLSIGISLFALWYYNSYVEGSAWLLDNFKFCWEIDPYSLYGT